jgi:3-deoxy-D-manno-octulosonic-acid transferase
MMRWIYTLIFYGCLPLIVVRLLWRSIKAPLYRGRWAERFAYYSTTRKPVDSQTVWLHTVSVGETIAAYPFALRLLDAYPQYSLLVTTTTPTGSTQVRRLYAKEIASGRVQHQYMPYDLPDCLSRFVKYWQPVCAIFMETEVWPNTLACCEQRSIPALLINARLSEKSCTGYQRMGTFAEQTFSRFTHIIAQSEADVARLRTLSRSPISVSGNLKSDIMISDDLREEAARLKREWSSNGEKTLIIAASTHKGEDEIILMAYRELLAEHSDIRLVIVPRHPERFEFVVKLCREQGINVACRSQPNTVTSDTSVIIGDSLGELMTFYGASDIAVVCGSFIEHGGHNMLEPAAWGLPVISGDSVYNFSTIAADMQHQNALVILSNEDELTVSLQRLLRSASESTLLGSNAKRYVEQTSGAIHKTLEVMTLILSPSVSKSSPADEPPGCAR